MQTFTVALIFGSIMIILGIINAMGNIRSLHWYHRQRVLPEDVKPFGRLIGIGNITLGASLITYGALMLAAEKMQNQLLSVIGSALLIIGAVICIALNFYGMIKYNKGIF